ncbi:flagellin [Cytobacillus firmus]|uniref:flagellin N-terminal helical domain-containing protein n=1 Tax=Cytobacillus firmus TaxID=1399 RepID=UPI001CFED03B|nr:flagellin [Cytobacillus firmus]
MRINHNIAALNTYRQLNSASGAQSKSMEKLSSGLRINRAGDDAAGLAISEKMRGQIRGLDQASKNSQDGISMIQTAEGALNETHSILQRMRELSVQSSNDTNTAEDRSNIQDEINQLGEEIQRIGEQTEFNTKKLLNGDMGAGQATATHVVSNSLEASMTGGTTLDSLVDANGNNVGLANGDTITATWSVGGTQYSQTLTIGTTAGTDTIADLTLSDISDQIATDGTIASATFTGNKLDITAAAGGTAAQINGLSIEVKSSAGVRKEAASNALSNFSTTTEAKDVRADGSADFQIGANQGQTLNLSFEDMRADTLGVRNLQVSTKSQAGTAISVLDEAIQKVSKERSKLGANQNRLEHTINNLNTSSENLTAAESRIRDVDMAKEMMEQTKNSILSQAAQAMLAQANQQPQGVLQLLR